MGVELRPARARSNRDLALEPEDRPTNWPRAIAKSLLAIVLAGVAAIGIGVAFAIAMPLAAPDRIVIGGLLVPMLWGAGMAWTLSDAKLLRATILLGAISALAYGIAFLPKVLVLLMLSEPPVKPKARPFLPPDFVRAMLAGHSALGLAFAALIYVVCISGAIAVFLFELQRWEQPNAPLVATRRGRMRSPPQCVPATHRRARTMPRTICSSAVRYECPQRFRSRTTTMKRGNEGEWLADEQGRLVTRTSAPWSEFIAELHMQLHLPRTWGLYLVGLTGVALFSSLISGLLSHPRIFKDAFALRWGGSRRLQEADLHNRLGVWGLPFHVVVSVTGALLGLSSLIVGVLALAAYDGDRAKAVSVLFGPAPGADESSAPSPTSLP